MATTAKRTESWYRKLKPVDGFERMEVSLVATIAGTDAPLKVRASGPVEAIWNTVAFFEEVTGHAVDAEWRRPPRTGARPILGQITIEEALDGDD